MAKTSDYHHGSLRSALIEAGAQLIEEKGTIDISLREVAKTAGVSHTAPYRHFKDKNALMSGITEVGFKQLAETRIRVPFDAVVIKKFAEIGMVTQPGEPLYQIQDQSRLKFRARVKERDLAHITINDTAQITITALGKKPVSASVISVIPSGDERHTFIVELALPAMSGIYPGMFGKVSFDH